MSNPLKKTMVFLGLAEEGLEDEQVAQAAPQRERERNSTPAPTVVKEQEQAPRAAVTPLRRVTPVRAQAPQVMNEIFTVHPTAYADAKIIAESYRDGVPVIMNLSRMGDDEAKRLIDFSSGLTLGLNGRIERVTSKVFLLTPEHIEIGTDEPKSDDDGSFFVTPNA